ncbi:MtrAB system histidine kinase MtrB [Gleimia hominis]|uniref:MtrAB system histidine kinase MtrB n=1 Tax=Gleimia hominis TaxID=595468 RepID=UPI0022B8CC78|nr:MtrAB system histidine kinase MtrB [Gleimia hominis]WIK64770.1 MtrAB system histidine kinase MtrB [Gleimia hominis]
MSSPTKLFRRIAHSRLTLPLRRSLSLRIAVIMSFVAIAILAALFLVVTYQVRADIFDQRRGQILDDASVRFTQAQSTFDQSTATTPDQVQDLANQLVSSLQTSSAGSGVISTVLLRSPSASKTFAINELIDRDLVDVISAKMRAQVAAGAESYYQSVSIPSENGTSVPAIVVGSLVRLPMAGDYELYLIYSLRYDQTVISTMFSTLSVGALPVVFILALSIFAIVYNQLRPVGVTARAATKLADGDLTARVRIRGEDEMAKLGRAFNNMADSLQETIAEYDKLSQLEQRFVSDVSHELRTPLTTIRMAEEILYDARQNLDPMMARSTELLHEQVDRFEKMLADLLEISRYDSRKASLEADVTDLRGVVSKVVEANQTLANKLSVPIEVDMPSTRCIAEVDHRRIERVLRNLLVNAIEHAEGKRVKITVATDPTSTAVRVRDWGVGMDEQTREHVFERFFRADPARTRTTGGTGLGLSIAKEDVALHHGVIEAYGVPDEGSAFLVTVPKVAGEDVRSFPLPLWEGVDHATTSEGGLSS